MATATSAQSSTTVAPAAAAAAEGVSDDGKHSKISVPCDSAVRQALAYAITLTDTMKRDLSLAHHRPRARHDVTVQCVVREPILRVPLSSVAVPRVLSAPAVTTDILACSLY